MDEEYIMLMLDKMIDAHIEHAANERISYADSRDLACRIYSGLVDMGVINIDQKED